MNNTQPTVVQWEYNVAANYSQYPLQKTLNIFGAEGWELVSIICDTSGYILYFKRPKQ